MPENPQEQTEAKLLAYIEGELDDDGRAEIERHIEANPKHRKLLLEMVPKDRRLVQMLPREAAPVDLFENVQAQLERQELLSSVADVNPETGNIRLTRWGQVRAAAAIVLLATGLSVMVYNVMPKKGGRSNLVVKQDDPSPASPTAGTTPQSDPREALASERDDSERGGGFGDESEERHLRMTLAADEARNLPAVQDALSADSYRRTEREVADKAAGSGQAVGGSMSRLPSTMPSKSAPSGPRFAVNARGVEPLYLVVASGDPSTTKENVLSLLSQGGLHYEEVATAQGPALHEGTEQGVAEPEGIQPGSEKAKDLALRDPKASSERDRAPADASSMEGGAGPEAGQGQLPGAAAPPAEFRSQLGQKGQAIGAQTRPSGVQEVLIVRRVRREQAQKLVAALNRPAQDRYALAYGSTPQFRRGGASAVEEQATPNRGVALSEQKRDADAAKKFGNASAGEPAAKAPARPPEPQQLRSAQQPQQPSPDSGMRDAKPGATRSLTPGEKNAGNEKAERAALQQGQQPAPADIGDRPAAAPMTESAAAPLQANEPVELVYLDMRRNGQPIAQPMRISARGTIYVAGYGEFALTGMSPAEATTRLTSAVKAKSPASKGVIVRRPSGENAIAKGGLAGGAGGGGPAGNAAMTRPVTAAPAAARPATPTTSTPTTSTPPSPTVPTPRPTVPTPEATPKPLAVTDPLAPNAPAATAPAAAGAGAAPAAIAAPAPGVTSMGAISATDDDQYVDVVIVLQRDLPAGAAESSPPQQ